MEGSRTGRRRGKRRGRGARNAKSETTITHHQQAQQVSRQVDDPDRVRSQKRRNGGESTRQKGEEGRKRRRGRKRRGGRKGRRSSFLAGGEEQDSTECGGDPSGWRSLTEDGLLRLRQGIGRELRRRADLSLLPPDILLHIMTFLSEESRMCLSTALCSGDTPLFLLPSRVTRLHLDSVLRVDSAVLFSERYIRSGFSGPVLHDLRSNQHVAVYANWTPFSSGVRLPVGRIGWVRKNATIFVDRRVISLTISSLFSSGSCGVYLSAYLVSSRKTSVTSFPVLLTDSSSDLYYLSPLPLLTSGVVFGTKGWVVLPNSSR